MRVNISLPYDLLRELQFEIPRGKRSEFITKAVSEKLKRKRKISKELIRSLKANRKFDEVVMKEWAITEAEGWPE